MLNQLRRHYEAPRVVYSFPIVSPPGMQAVSFPLLGLPHKGDVFLIAINHDGTRIEQIQHCKACEADA